MSALVLALTAHLASQKVALGQCATLAGDAKVRGVITLRVARRRDDSVSTDVLEDRPAVSARTSALTSAGP